MLFGELLLVPFDVKFPKGQSKIFHLNVGTLETMFAHIFLESEKPKFMNVIKVCKLITFALYLLH